jgi:hypothetical protein
LQGHVQQGGDFLKVDLRSGQCFQSVWEGVSFTDSRLSMVHFVNSKWVNCHFVRTDIYGANFNAGSLHDVTVTGCDGEQVSFAGAILRNVVFRDCRLAYSSFVGATLHNVVFDNCNLHGADLDYAAATGVQYAHSNLWSAKTTFGCAFWNSGFTVDTCNRFAALLARVHPDPAAKAALVAIAGEATFKAVSRLMDEQPDDGAEF